MINLILNVISNCTMTFTQKVHQFSEVGNQARRICKIITLFLYFIKKNPPEPLSSSRRST